MPSCKKCGEPIVWNRDHYAETGKWVPFDEETDEPHNCLARDYYTGERGSSGGEGRGMDRVDSMAMSNAINNLEDRMDEVNKTMLKILSAVQTLQIRVEGQMPLFPTTASTDTITASQVDKPINESETVALSEADNDLVGSGGNENGNADIST